MNRGLFAIVLTTMLLAACAPAAPPPHALTLDDALGKMTPPHFVDSSPNHGDVFALAPDKVLMNFDRALTEGSSIQVTQDGKSVAVGQLEFGANRISMAVALPKNAGDGAYSVKYRACLPDNSCGDGSFAFKVDLKAQSAFVDRTGKRAVTIRMKDIKYSPAQIVVSQGTQVTWVNDDAVTHFVNSDPHPSHNALPALNSLMLELGESFSFTFDQPGEWAYHCSAHVPANMAGRIIVVAK